MNTLHSLLMERNEVERFSQLVPTDWFDTRKAYAAMGQVIFPPKAPIYLVQDGKEMQVDYLFFDTQAGHAFLYGPRLSVGNDKFVAKSPKLQSEVLAGLKQAGLKLREAMFMVSGIKFPPALANVFPTGAFDLAKAKLLMPSPASHYWTVPLRKPIPYRSEAYPQGYLQGVQISYQVYPTGAVATVKIDEIVSEFMNSGKDAEFGDFIEPMKQLSDVQGLLQRMVAKL